MHGAGFDLFNWHILRQFARADGGSGFGDHQDEVDDDVAGGQLFLSGSVKLTADPEGSHGTWMKLTMPAHSPVRYPPDAGGFVIFPSRAVHRSLQTAPSMGRVIKIVFFWRRSTAPAVAAPVITVQRPSRKRRSR